MEIKFSKQKSKKLLSMFLVIILTVTCLSGCLVASVGALGSEETSGYVLKGDNNLTGGNLTDGNLTDGNVTDGNLPEKDFYSGVFGEDLTWTLDIKTGLLEIKGMGEMPYCYDPWDDSEEIDDAPWKIYSDYIFEAIIENGVTSIGGGAFADCVKLEKVTIADSVKIIGEGAFYKCKKLKEIVIPDGVERIGGYAFEWCESLENIVIPDSVTYIEAGTLQNTAYSNNDANWEDGALYIGRHLMDAGLIYEANAIKNGEYKIKDGTLTIAGGAFQTFKVKASDMSIGMKHIILPEGLKTIGRYAFYNYYGYLDEFESITIPSSVDLIGEGAFRFCSSLSNVYYDGTEKEWDLINIEEYNDELIKANIYFNDGNVEHTHKYESKITKEATLEETGIMTYTCACGNTYTEVISKLSLVEDEKTKVGLVLQEDDYNGEVSVLVEEIYDTKVTELLNKELKVSKSKSYDIKLLVDGVEVQPKGKVTVRIPLAEGFDANNTQVYYVNVENGSIENMNAKYIDGYLVFETNHFSNYTLVETEKTTVNGNENDDQNNEKETETPKTGVTIAWVAAVITMVVAASIILVITKKKIFA